MYTFQHTCVTSQCTIPTYLSTIRYTIPVVHPSCVLPLCTTPACMCTIRMYQCHISVYHLTAQSQCIYVPSQYTSIHSQYSNPVYLPSIPAYPCAILVYHHSIPVFYPNTPVYHLQQGSIKPRPILILLDVLQGWFISNVWISISLKTWVSSPVPFCGSYLNGICLGGAFFTDFSSCTCKGLTPCWQWESSVSLHRAQLACLNLRGRQASCAAPGTKCLKTHSTLHPRQDFLFPSQQRKEGKTLC